MATGIANYFGIDPVVVQIGFVVLAFAAGAGIPLYVAGWLLIPPSTSSERRPIAITSNPVAVVLGALILAISVSALLSATDFGLSGTLLVPLALVGAGLYLLNQQPQPHAQGGMVDSTGPVDTGPLDAGPLDTAGHTAMADPYGRPPPPNPPPPPPTGSWATPRTDDAEPEPQVPGPPITAVTLAAAATVTGLLLLLDQVTDLDIGATVIVGSGVAIVGAGLVTSAFVGRALALIPIGLLGLLGLLVTPIVDPFIGGGVGERIETVSNEADLQDNYELGAGPMELDLRAVELSSDRTVNIDVGAGYVEILAPRDTRVRVTAKSRFGYVEAFGEERSGVNNTLVATAGPDEPPVLTIVAEITFGYVEVRRG